MADRFLIAPLQTGLQTNLPSWMIMEDAFETLNNAYVWRGRVRKRFGGGLMNAQQGITAGLLSRFRINVGTTDGSGSAAGTVPGDIFQVGQIFSIRSTIYTVVNSTPGLQTMLDTVGSTATKQFDVSTGNFVFAGAPATTVIYFYSAQPVMGLTNYEVGPINDQPSYGFDTQFAYVFTGPGGWQRSGSGTTPEWHGNDLNFFWTDNWEGIEANNKVLFVTNFQVTNMNGIGTVTDDPIWAFNGTIWARYIPYFLPNNNPKLTGPFVQTSRIIVAFKDRLLFLNTIENDGTGTGNPADGSYVGGNNTWYPNRARYSFNGSPFARNAWYEPNQMDSSPPDPGTTDNIGAGAGFIDATTDEQIISAEFIKDRLIVYFERSTWELAYTGNQVLPFVWQKLNTELGSEGTLSSVPFDKQILTIGNVGVHACNGSNVQRIDNKIPDLIFQFTDANNDNQRIGGIRDYKSEVVYWNYPQSNQAPTQTYPDKILIYNYQNDTWATNDDTVTAWGYFEQQTNITWAASEFSWQNNNNTWESGVEQAEFRQVIAGNQQGFVFLVLPDTSRNAPVLYITNITGTPTSRAVFTVINHNLRTGDYVYIENIPFLTTVPDFTDQIFSVRVIDSNTFSISPPLLSGTYTGGGTITRVSDIQIKSKRWNPYISQGRNFYLSKIDFGVQRTAAGAITVDYFPSSAPISLVEDGTATTTIMGNGILETSPYDPTLYPLESVSDFLWHPIYFQSYGEFIQIYMSLSGTESTPVKQSILDVNTALEDFQIQGLILHTQLSGARLE
jgi:hypothetical protein